MQTILLLLSLTTELPKPLNWLQTSPGAKTAEPGTSGTTWHPVPGPPWAGLTSQGRPCRWGWGGAEAKGTWEGRGEQGEEEGGEKAERQPRG